MRLPLNLQRVGERGGIKVRNLPTGNNLTGVIEREFPIEKKCKE